MLEGAIGLMLLLNLVKEGQEKLVREKLTRRRFLKKSIKALGGLYFMMSPGFHRFPYDVKSMIAGRPNVKGAEGAVQRFLVDLEEKIHPETTFVILTLRNYLLAQKMKTIIKSLGRGDKKPEFSYCGRRRSYWY